MGSVCATFTLVLAWLCTLLLASCDSRDSRADLVVLNGAEPESIDPAIITGQLDGRVAYCLFEGLLHFDQSGQPKPGIARSWDISADRRIYTFHLRPEAKWSNGDPVTATDFVGSWRRVLLPETASEYAYILYPIKNAEAFNESKTTDFSTVGVKALDAHTLQVELENPTPYFLDLCCFMTYLPVHLPSIQKYGDDWIKPHKLVNNGPFLLDQWKLNYRIRLKKNPYFWDAKNVHLETVDLLPIDNAITAYNFYASKVADLILDKGLTPSSLIPELKTRSDFHAAPFLGDYFIRFNVTRKPFTDPRVRQAFAMVIDRERIIQKITQAGEPPAYSFTPPGTGNGYKPPHMFNRDPERARALLAEAGYPNGKGFPAVSYLYDNKKLNEDIAIEIQSMLAEELGIHVELIKQEWKVYLNSMNRLDYDFCRSSWIGDYNDPNTFLECFVTNGGNNRTGWSNPTYDSLIAAAAKEPDEARRFTILNQAEDILLNQGTPICPLYFYMGIQIYDGTKLGGIEPNLIDGHPIRDIYRLRTTNNK
ncbi:MAG: peptide ABC transporter substrate-binding protein [Verrucomicrobia bacterium]|nr:peptide ABC transporter substrate-binding protein [Verrucomicrobiota bacterium]MBV9275118.1 peptide ABC transporter substrate-binding protein [Verrucomicrobiota bacterium]